MPYKVGYCPSCGAEIMTKDSNGQFNSIKPIFRQVDLCYDSGQRIRSIMCESCVDNGFDKEKVLQAITCDASGAAGPSVRNYIKDLGPPSSYELANTFQGASIRKKKIKG